MAHDVQKWLRRATHDRTILDGTRIIMQNPGAVHKTSQSQSESRSTVNFGPHDDSGGDFYHDAHDRDYYDYDHYHHFSYN